MRRALALFAAALVLLCMFQPTSQAAELEDEGTLFGTVVGADQLPFSYVTVEARNTTSGIIFFTLTNETGAYELDVPFGTYNVSAVLTNYTANISYSMIMVPNMLGPYNFTMSEVLGRVVGFVTDDERPVYNVQVTISNEEFNYSVMSTAPFGRYEINGVKPGSYIALAEKRGYNVGNFPAPLMVERGAALEINFTLEPQPAMVFGSVDTENERSIDQVKVTLSATDGTLNTFTFTDSDGNYTITGLSAGLYTMTFEKDGYETETRTLDFNPYETKRVDVTLVRIEENATTVLFGYDLTHSLMIIGFFTGLVIVLLGVFVSIRSNKKPEMLAQIDKEERRKED